jgi:hypothetical protein
MSLASIKGQFRLAPHNNLFFLVSKENNDAEIARYLTFLDKYLQTLDPNHVPVVATDDWLHGNLFRFLCLVPRSGLAASQKKAPDSLRFAALCNGRANNLAHVCKDLKINDVVRWFAGIEITTAHPFEPLTPIKNRLVRAIEEIVDSLGDFIREVSPRSVAPGTNSGGQSQTGRTDGLRGSIEDYVPQGILNLRTETFMPIVRSWFEKSLAVPGDIAEFGCFKGTMSVKYAFYVRALNLPKTVYAFDTFEGFTVDDTAGGTITIGAYRVDDEIFEELERWSKVLPIVPVKGDAAQTCKRLANPLSFVWLDLDLAVFLDPVLRHVLPLCSRDTVIGLDDYGRPQTPTVKPWADAVEQEGLWEKVHEYWDQAFYRVCR